MVANDALMQFQADILGVPVIRPKVVETTALGAAYAAGLAVGFWKDLGECSANWSEDKRWEPQMDQAERERQMRLWKKAVTKSMDWVDEDVGHALTRRGCAVGGYGFAGDKEEAPAREKPGRSSSCPASVSVARLVSGRRVRVPARGARGHGPDPSWRTAGRAMER